MKLMIFSTEGVYNELVVKLQSEGHEVELVTPASFLTLFLGYEDSHIYARRKIEEFQPTHVLNNIPALNLDSTEYEYVANSVQSAQLETEKWQTRQKANELGFLLPEVLEECTMDGISQTYSEDVFLKPKGSTSGYRSWKIPANTNHETHNSYFAGDGNPAYIERQVNHSIEAVCHFTISNNSFKIQYIRGYTSVGNEKIYGGDDVTGWQTGTRYEILSPDLFSSWESQCLRWLDYAATLGGSYQGGIAAGVTDEGFYWYEQNSRRATGVKFIGDCETWWESLVSDCSKASSSHWEFDY